MASDICFTVLGAPRTKKTHNQLVPGRGRAAGRSFVLPSKPWRAWVKGAQLLPRIPRLPDQLYNCRAHFYRDRASGDAVGFYQGLADALEEWAVLSDDKFLSQWDGSRLFVDRIRPRVEVILSPL